MRMTWRQMGLTGLVSCFALGACGPPEEAPPEFTGRTIKIGYISPQTGPLGGFGEADKFAIDDVRAAVSRGITIGDKLHPVEILVRDSQSSVERASSLADTLILEDMVDVLMSGATPETTNPVTSRCEAHGVPCISSLAPWQPWFFRDANPNPTYDWSYHFFWGLEDIIPVFIGTWDSVETNKVVGVLWPNDGDGQAWADPTRGFPPPMESAGYTVVDPGRYENLTEDFSAQIALFKEKNVEVVTGVMLPPDLANFISQASQAGFKPKVVTVAKAALFPASVEAIPGRLGDGLTSEIWWSGNHPYKSSLSDLSPADLVKLYETETNKQATPMVGFVHALFEVAVSSLKRTTDLENPAAIRDAIKTTELDTIVGKIQWGNGPVPNVCKTPLVGGQWRRGTEHPFELVITTNELAPNIPVSASTQPMKWEPDYSPDPTETAAGGCSAMTAGAAIPALGLLAALALSPSRRRNRSGQA